MPEFEAFPKIARLKRNIVITEKLDGTNAAVGITPDGEFYCQSRNRIITPQDDNYGFATWAYTHRAELTETLGPGLHFGEWWGSGIGRRYGIDEKRFSLFNTGRWTADSQGEFRCAQSPVCFVVPVLVAGTFSTEMIDDTMAILNDHGSYAAPGFSNPEGIVVFHSQTKQLYKVTFEHDEKGKGDTA